MRKLSRMSQTFQSLGAGHSFTPSTALSTRPITSHSLELTHRLLATPSQCCRKWLSPRVRPEQRHSSRLLPLLGARFRASVSAPAATAVPTDPLLPFQVSILFLQACSSLRFCPFLHMPTTPCLPTLHVPTTHLTRRPPLPDYHEPIRPA